MARADKEAKFLVLDVEDDTLASCGAANLAKASQAFIDTCQEVGKWVYMYHTTCICYGLNTVNADFLWIPRYGNKPAYSCDLWRYTETGSLAGVTGNVDLNYLNSKNLLNGLQVRVALLVHRNQKGLGSQNQYTGKDMALTITMHGNYLGTLRQRSIILGCVLGRR